MNSLCETKKIFVKQWQPMWQTNSSGVFNVAMIRCEKTTMVNSIPFLYSRGKSRQTKLIKEWKVSQLYRLPLKQKVFRSFGYQKMFLDEWRPESFFFSTPGLSVKGDAHLCRPRLERRCLLVYWQVATILDYQQPGRIECQRARKGSCTAAANCTTI